MKILVIITLCLLALVTVAVDQGDWVDGNAIAQIVAPQYYAGYLKLTTTQSYYYHYFPSESNPDKDPLIVRISAGPGCSALYSAYYSKGPFIFTKNTKTFRHNPFNWNKQANLIFIEGPAGVGFSKGTDIKYEDELSAEQYIFSLLKFYEKFPELKDQTVYLSGQQYAGIIVPRMADLIVKLNNNPETPAWQKIKLGGFILNNPCTSGDQCDSHFEFTPHTMRFLKNRYFISEAEYQKYLDHCTVQTSQCEGIKKGIQSRFLQTGADLRNIYNECINQDVDMKCFDQIGILDLLNNNKTKELLHADANITWKMCNNDIQQKWIRDPEGSVKIYETLLRQEHNLKIWIISGGLSGVVPITGTKRWFEILKRNLGTPMIRMWEPWFFNNTINAGDIEEVRGITFITVRSGGYYLWNDQPEIGWHIVDSFLKGNPL